MSLSQIKGSIGTSQAPTKKSEKPTSSTGAQSHGFGIQNFLPKKSVEKQLKNEFTVQILPRENLMSKLRSVDPQGEHVQKIIDNLHQRTPSEREQAMSILVNHPNANENTQFIYQAEKMSISAAKLLDPEIGKLHDSQDSLKMTIEYAQHMYDKKRGGAGI